MLAKPYTIFKVSLNCMRSSFARDTYETTRLRKCLIEFNCNFIKHSQDVFFADMMISDLSLLWVDTQQGQVNRKYFCCEQNLD